MIGGVLTRRPFTLAAWTAGNVTSGNRDWVLIVGALRLQVHRCESWWRYPGGWRAGQTNHGYLYLSSPRFVLTATCRTAQAETARMMADRAREAARKAELIAQNAQRGFKS